MSIVVPLLDHDLPVIGIPFPNVPSPATRKAARYGASHSTGAANDRAVSASEKALAFVLGKRLATTAQKLAL